DSEPGDLVAFRGQFPTLAASCSKLPGERRQRGTPFAATNPVTEWPDAAAQKLQAVCSEVEWPFGSWQGQPLTQYLGPSSSSGQGARSPAACDKPDPNKATRRIRALAASENIFSPASTRPSSRSAF